jgi:hypothetical protein
MKIYLYVQIVAGRYYSTMTQNGDLFTRGNTVFGVQAAGQPRELKAKLRELALPEMAKRDIDPADVVNFPPA